MSIEVTSPFTVFYDRSGQPLDAGYIYIGTAGINPEVSPITVYWDSTSGATASQPIRTLNGYPSRDGSPGSLVINQTTYSIIVRDRNGTLVYSDLNASFEQTNVTDVDTYADLTALTPTDKSQFSVAGRTSPNDGGAGLFVFILGDTTPADGGFTCLANDANTGRFRRLFVGAVHSLWGCKGDGSTSDQAALQTLLGLTSTYDIHFDRAPGSKYNFTAALSANPANGRVITSDGFQARLDYVGASTNIDLVTFGDGTARNDLTIWGLYVTSSTTMTGGYALRVKDYTDLRLYVRPKSDKLWKGLRLEGCSYVWLNDSDFFTPQTRLELNDGVEINLGSSEFRTPTSTTGYHVLVGGGVGGLYGQHANSLFGDVGVYVDTSLARLTTLTGTTTLGSNTITSITTTNVVLGMSINNANIPAGAYVTSKTASTVVMSQNATASGTVPIDFFNGNTQIMLNDSVWDSAVNAAVFLNDATVRPSGKILCVDNAWLTSCSVGSGLVINNWKGDVNIPGGFIRSNAGYGVNIVETASNIRIGTGADIGWNGLQGVGSTSPVTIRSTCEPHDNTGGSYTSNITITPVSRSLTFTSSGTWTKPTTTGLRAVRVRVMGSGGGGGGVSNAAGYIAGGGGGQGEYAEKYILASALGATETVTIGAAGAAGANTGGNGGTGGTSSFGSLVTALGGSGGTGATAATFSAGGDGGTGGTGADLAVPGAPGSFALVSATEARGGTGGGQGGGRGRGAATAGLDGVRGGGGAGACSSSSTTANIGGAGGTGWVVVEEIY